MKRNAETMLQGLLGSRTRARLVAALLSSPDRSLHFRALVRATGGSVAAVQREIERLGALGLIRTAPGDRGRRMVELVGDHPFVRPLEGLVAADPRAQYTTRIAALQNVHADVADALEDAVDAIITSFDPIKIILFGSQAKGTADKDSDVDLLVVLPNVDDDHRTAVELMGAVRSPEVSFEVIPTDPRRIETAMTRMASVVRDAIEEGVTLYERSA